MENKQDDNLSNALSSSYMLASCSVRVYSGRKTDKQLTESIISQSGAVSDAGAFVKKLFAGADAELKEVQAAYNHIRNWFYANSLQWTSNNAGGARGDRLIATGDVMGKLGEFANLKKEAELARDKFIAALPSAMSKAAANLGTMYDQTNYPDPAELAVLFDAGLNVAPLPDIQDFDRLTIPGKLTVGLKDLYAKQADTCIDNALKEMQQRTLDALNRMVTQLTKLSKGEKTRVYKSLTGNLQHMVQMLRNNNLRNDPALDLLATEIETKLLKYDSSAYKDNVSLAGVVATHAKEIVGRIAVVPVVVATTPVKTEVGVLAQSDEAEVIVAEGVETDVECEIVEAPTVEAEEEEAVEDNSEEVDAMLKSMDFDDVFFN